MNRRLLGALLGLVVIGLGVTSARVSRHDAAARASQSPRAVVLGTAPRALVTARLEPGMEVAFEACSSALHDPAALPSGLTFTVRDLDANEVAVSQPLDAALARRVVGSPRFGCVAFASTKSLGAGGRLAVEASSATPLEAPFIGRIVRRLALGWIDRSLVAGFALLAAATIAVLARRRETASDGSAGSPEDERRSAVRGLALATAGLLLGFGVSRAIPLGGAMGGLVRGSVLLFAQIAVVAVLVRGRDDEATRRWLGAKPVRAILIFLAAPVLAVGVQLLAQLLLRFIPATGVSAVERLVSPSAGVAHVQVILDSFGGLLAFGAIGVLAPVVEELFFRGIVYGALERARGANVATLGTIVAFALAHVPQLLGARGAAVSLLVLATVATLLRRRTGSVVASSAMHLVHNTLVVFVALLQAK